ARARPRGRSGSAPMAPSVVRWTLFLGRVQRLRDRRSALLPKRRAEGDLLERARERAVRAIDVLRARGVERGTIGSVLGGAADAGRADEEPAHAARQLLRQIVPVLADP